jgi:hypothetical protein
MKASTEIKNIFMATVWLSFSGRPIIAGLGTAEWAASPDAT